MVDADGQRPDYFDRDVSLRRTLTSATANVRNGLHWDGGESQQALRDARSDLEAVREQVDDQLDYIDEMLHGPPPADSDDEIEIRGHSDDIVNVEGAVSEELYFYGDGTLEISPGYVVDVAYDGEWHFDVVEKPERPNYEVSPVPDDDNSEVLRINHPHANYEIEKRE